MSDDIEPVSDVGKAVGALVEASGLLGPVKIAETGTFAEAPLTTRLSVGGLTETEGVTRAGVDNLIRVGVLRHEEEPADSAWEDIGARRDMIANLRFTVQGWAFVQACREPRPAD